MAGLVVALAAPPVATTPVNDGSEKYVFSQAAGALAVIDASFVKVTVNVPFAATVSGFVNVWVLPEVAVEKLHTTSLGVVEIQPV